jgi:hypothetical protein
MTFPSPLGFFFPFPPACFSIDLLYGGPPEEFLVNSDSEESKSRFAGYMRLPLMKIIGSGPGLCYTAKTTVWLVFLVKIKSDILFSTDRSCLVQFGALLRCRLDFGLSFRGRYRQHRGKILFGGGGVEESVSITLTPLSVLAVVTIFRQL